MLGGRDALDLRGEVHPMVLVVQVGTLRDDEPILDWIVERRQFMNLDSVGRLAPTDRRGRLPYTLKIQFAQIELDNRRAIFDRGADKGVLVYLRDNRRKLHLHSYSHPTPFAPQMCHWIRCGKDSCTVCPWPRGRTYRPRTRPTSCRKD